PRNTGPVSDVPEARQGIECAGDVGCVHAWNSGRVRRRDLCWIAFGEVRAAADDCSCRAPGVAGDSAVDLEPHGRDAGAGWFSDAVDGAGGVGGDSGAPE